MQYIIAYNEGSLLDVHDYNDLPVGGIVDGSLVVEAVCVCVCVRVCV